MVPWEEVPDFCTYSMSDAFLSCETQRDHMCEDPGVFGGDGQQHVRRQRANTAVMLMEDNQGGVC